MRKFWFLLLVCCTAALYAGESIEVYATKIDSNGTALHAYGDVVVLYQDHYLSANEALYYREKGELELFGNITAMQGAAFFAIGEYARFNIVEKERLFSPFYMLDKTSDVWASCKEAHAKEIIEMVSNYLSDAKYFESKNDFVNSFAALNYAHGWLDSGVRLDVFKTKNDKLFTIK